MNVQSLALYTEKYVQQRLTQYIEELRDLCSIDSDSHYKPGLDEMATYLAARMHGLGMDVTIIEREHWGNDLLGVFPGEGSGVVLLLGHTDTVYPVGTATARPLRIEGDTIYGPGVCDMKGCLLSGLYAIEALLAAGYRSFGEIRFLCVSDEEISPRHSKDILQEACQGCDVAFVLEAARANGDIVSARKGLAWYTLTARGRAAHAGVEPEKGRNALVELAHQIMQFYSLNAWREGVTINPGDARAPGKPNVISDFAQVSIEMRYLLSQDRIETEKRWEEMMQQQLVPGVTLTLEMNADFRDPMVCTPESLKLVAIAQETANYLRFSINHTLTGGISDANYASGYGVPVLDGLGPIGGDDHSPNEYLMANSIAPRTALLAGLIAATGGQAIDYVII